MTGGRLPPARVGLRLSRRARSLSSRLGHLHTLDAPDPAVCRSQTDLGSGVPTPGPNPARHSVFRSRCCCTRGRFGRTPAPRAVLALRKRNECLDISQLRRCPNFSEAVLAFALDNLHRRALSGGAVRDGPEACSCPLNLRPMARGISGRTWRRQCRSPWDNRYGAAGGPSGPETPSMRLDAQGVLSEFKAPPAEPETIDAFRDTRKEARAAATARRNFARIASASWKAGCTNATKCEPLRSVLKRTHRRVDDFEAKALALTRSFPCRPFEAARDRPIDDRNRAWLLGRAVRALSFLQENFLLAVIEGSAAPDRDPQKMYLSSSAGADGGFLQGKAEAETGNGTTPAGILLPGGASTSVLLAGRRARLRKRLVLLPPESWWG